MLKYLSSKFPLYTLIAAAFVIFMIEDAKADNEDPDAICKKSAEVGANAPYDAKLFREISDGNSAIVIDPSNQGNVEHLGCMLARWRNPSSKHDHSAFVLIANELSQAGLDGTRAHFTGLDGVRHASPGFPVPPTGLQILLFVGPANAFYLSAELFGEPVIAGPIDTTGCAEIAVETISDVFSKFGKGSLHTTLEIDKLKSETSFYLFALHNADSKSDFIEVISDTGTKENWKTLEFLFSSTDFGASAPQFKLGGTLFCR